MTATGATFVLSRSFVALFDARLDPCFDLVFNPGHRALPERHLCGIRCNADTGSSARRTAFR